MTRDADERTTRAALFAAGALPSGVQVDPADAASFERAILTLTSDFPVVTPPVEFKTKLFNRLNEIDPPLLFRQRDDGAFVDSQLPGVSYRMLHTDPRRRIFTALVRMAPGTSLRSHDHADDLEPEECLVLEGELIVGETRMKTGDYQRAAAGAHHYEQRTETGALLYFRGSLDFLATAS
jgi:quercetin dioxygenase-like cupin family protein